MTLNYSDKQLTYIFGNNQGFDASGNTTLTISQVESVVTVGGYGNTTGVTAEAVITGLSLEILEMLSSKGNGIYSVGNPRITLKILAENTLIFSGSIYASYPNMNTLPKPQLMINAVTAYDARSEVTPPFSVKGETTLGAIIDSLAQAQNWSVQISPTLSAIVVVNPYLQGNTYSRLVRLCDAYSLQFSVNNDTVSVWTQEQSIDDLIPFVSAETGLVGYPMPSQAGLNFQTTFSPLLQGGRRIRLETQLPNGSGEYMLYQVQHVLSSWTNNGPWHSLCQATRWGRL